MQMQNKLSHVIVPSILILQPSHAQGAGGSYFFSCPSLSQRLEYSLDPFILPRKPYVHL